MVLGYLRSKPNSPAHSFAAADRGCAFFSSAVAGRRRVKPEEAKQRTCENPSMLRFAFVSGLRPLSRTNPPLPSSQLSCFLRTYNSWASAIRGAASPHEALHFYIQMQRLSIALDSFTFLFTLKACFPLHNLPLIRQLHAHIFKTGFQDHVYVATSLLNAYFVVSFGSARRLFNEMPAKNPVTWNSMIAGYSKCGDVANARLVFEEMPSRNMVSWSSMIAGYINNGCYNEGLSLFREMLLRDQRRPDQATLGSVLSGCAQVAYLSLAGKSIHGFVVKNGWELNVEFGTALVNMYAKSGFLKIASRVFGLMQERNVMSWTALICGSAQHGYGNEAITIFEKMHEVGVRPNEMTFTGILSACVQAGLIDEGRRYFSMIKEYGLEPRVHHYGCMVDLFGRAGLLQDAYEVIRTMRLEPNVVVWGSFLSACKMHKQFEMAEKVIEQVLRMVKPESDGGVYSLICDLYTSNGRWNHAERVRSLMVHQNVKKVRGSSYIKRDVESRVSCKSRGSNYAG